MIAFGSVMFAVMAVAAFLVVAAVVLLH